uniref:Uncharacterized protein n=1 Tax=Glossina pallidipes TaxID=7398 RepID=A0A1A9ZQC5_GLOPL
MLNPYTVALCLIVANEGGLMVWTNLKIENALHNHSLLTQHILVDGELKSTIEVTIVVAFKEKEKQYKQVEKLKDSCTQREANKSPPSATIRYVIQADDDDDVITRLFVFLFFTKHFPMLLAINNKPHLSDLHYFYCKRFCDRIPYLFSGRWRFKDFVLRIKLLLYKQRTAAHGTNQEIHRTKADFNRGFGHEYNSNGKRNRV